MWNVKPLLLVLLACSILSCRPTNPTTTRMGDEKKSECGEIPIGVTIDKRELDIAGASLLDFSLGKLVIKDTPQFEKIISEAGSNLAVTDILVCKTIARAGARDNPELVDYFTREIHFLAVHPSTSQQLEWQNANPFPKTNIAQSRSPKPANTETAGSVQAPQESLSDRLVRTCKQPLDGLNRQPEGFLWIWLGSLSQLRRDKFPAQRDLQSLYHIKGHLRDVGYNDPDEVFRESLYTLKCLVDAGELIRLESTGTTGKYGEKFFENQRIIFP